MSFYIEKGEMRSNTMLLNIWTLDCFYACRLPLQHLISNFRKRQKVDEGGSSNIAEMDEEAQMAAAIKASLEQMVSSKDTEENDDGDNIELSDFDDTVDTSKDSLSETPRGEKSKLESQATPVNGEHNGSEKGGQSVKDEDIGWRKYLGEPGDELTNILIRLVIICMNLALI